jgi:hypothetical protein
MSINNLSLIDNLKIESQNCSTCNIIKSLSPSDSIININENTFENQQKNY